MAATRCVALEWDRRELRALVFSGGGRHVEVEGAYAFPFGPDGQPKEPSAVGSFLRESLTSVGVTVKSVSVVAGPGEVLLRHLRLPVAPEDEVAGMVRFQATGELSANLEGAGLDYTLLPREGDGQLAVLAAVLPAAPMRRYSQAAEAAGLSVQHLVLRGQASGAALRQWLRARGAGAADGAALLVDFTADTVCLSLLVEGASVLTRWRRPPSAQDGPPEAAFVAGEIARTLTAFHAQFPASTVKEIYLAGGPEEQRGLAKDVADALGRAVELFDPRDLFGGPATQAWPEDRGRFCALAGLAGWLSHGQKPPLDFLHPKEPRKRTGKGRRLAVAFGAAAAVLLGGTALWYVLTQRALSGELSALRQDVERLDTKLKQYADVDRDYNAIRDWTAHEVNWLDELYEVSQRFPQAQDAYATKLDFMPHTGRLESRMILNAAARQEGVVGTFQREMRKDAKRYVVHPLGVQEQASVRDYPWQFRTEIRVNSARDATAETPNGAAPAASGNGGQAPSAAPASTAASASKSDANSSQQSR